MSSNLIDTTCAKNTSSATLTVATSSRLSLLRRGNTDWESFTPLRDNMAYRRHARQRTTLAEPANAPAAPVPARAAALPKISFRPPAAAPSISQRTRSRAAYMGLQAPPEPRGCRSKGMLGSNLSSVEIIKKITKYHFSGGLTKSTV
ncbi:unnamed protein product [Arabis nemorensis]|uniref:Uncharacterized protein n=1 Tax=Arabis nemorensis TaxID=586526 RepID=A0A565BLW6_9BRAS|nr:unnamed protein product [Arabis nemorensis]